MSTLPVRMKAMLYDSSERTMRFTQDALVPKIKKNQLLVKVHAAGINPIDYKIPKIPVMGWMRRGSPVGLDFSGEIVQVGSTCSQFKVGDVVYGNTRGTMCEYAVCEQGKIAIKPTNISHVEAASLPTAALTSYQALTTHSLSDGQKLLVLGASGGCGNLGVQIGKILGATVTGVCGTSNVDFVKSLGADDVIDYKKQDFSEVLPEHSQDYIFDTVTSGDTCDPNYEPAGRKVLKEGKMYVVLNGAGSDWMRKFVKWQRPQFDMILTNHSGDNLSVLAKWVEEGKLKPVIAKEAQFTAEGVHGLFDELKSRRTVGKLVCSIINSQTSEADEKKTE